MSQDYSKSDIGIKSSGHKKTKRFLSIAIRVVIIIGWVTAAFFAAQLIVELLLKLLLAVGVSLSSLNETILVTTVSGLIYILAIVLVIGLPWLFKKYKTSRADVGLEHLPTWMDIIISPAGYVIYMLVSILLMSLATAFFPSFNVAEPQNVGFGNLNFQYEYILAFITLVIIAPVAEEVLFRGYLFGKLRKLMPLWVAVLITSLFFGVIHGAWNVALDTFALSVVLCTLRVTTGGLWAPILLHMIKNSIAFYVLFINPSLISTLGG